ncbi:Oligo-1,6-glucosidase [compost metagenome]
MYAYLRTLGEERLLVMLNFFGRPAAFELPAGVVFQDKTLVIANYGVQPEEDIRSLSLRPYEARVYRLR